MDDHYRYSAGARFPAWRTTPAALAVLPSSTAWETRLRSLPSSAMLALSRPVALKDTENLVVPVITIYEVFKKVLRESGESEALQVPSLICV